ncbi:MAG: hypothetical protein HRU12_06325 [Phaeodactylibacter sp.]|nr:hypothetical protein [Phaeodactylibacter sp.]
MTKCVLCPLFLLFLCTGLSAQDMPAGRWGITAGWTESFIHDAHASPLLYQSDVLNVGGLYQRPGPFFFEVALSLSIGNNRPQQLGKRKAEIEEVPDIYGEVETYEIEAYPLLSIFKGDLQVRGLWQLSDGHQLGMSFNTQYTYTGLGIDTWQFAQVSIGPAYQYRYPVWQGNIEAAFSIPLVGAVVRPNYAFDPSLPDETNYFLGYLRTGTRVATFPKLLNPRLRAGYNWSMGEGKSVGAYYNMEWLSYSYPRPMRSFSHGVDLIYFF